MGHSIVKVDIVLWKISFHKYNFLIILHFQYLHYRNKVDQDVDQNVCLYASINVLQYICQESGILFHFFLQVCSD